MWRVKGITICLMLAVVLILTGCRKKEVLQKEAVLPIVRIALINTNEKPRDLKLVNEQLAKLTEDKAGCKVELVWMNQNVNNSYRYFKGEEAVDIMGLSYSNFQDYQQRGFLMRLDSYMEEEGKGILEVMDREADAFRMSDGHIYGIPKPMQDINSNGLMFSKKYLDKYGLEVDSIKTFEDLEPLLEVIHEKESGVIPFARNVPTLGLIQRNSIGDLLDGMLSMIYYEDDNMQVQNMYETKEFEQRAKIAKRWYDKGYLGENPATENEVGEELVFSGQAFATEFVIRPDEVEYAKIQYGDAVVIQPLDTQPHLSTTSDWTYVWTVSAHCIYPAEAVKVLNLLYSDEDFQNIVLYGVEGVHYVEQEDGTIAYPEGVDRKNVGYFNNNKWFFNRKIGKLWDGMPADVMDELEEFNKSAVVSPAYGFRFDESQVSFDLVPLKQVLSEYQFRIGMGMYDSNQEIREFQRRLRKAGAKELTDEVQRQLDLWRSTK